MKNYSSYINIKMFGKNITRIINPAKKIIHYTYSGYSFVIKENKKPKMTKKQINDIIFEIGYPVKK